MVKVEFGPRGITLQESCDEKGKLANTFILRGSLENYDCQEPIVIPIPKCIKRMGGKCVSIEISRVDSWRVRSIFLIMVFPMKFLVTRGMSCYLHHIWIQGSRLIDT